MMKIDIFDKLVITKFCSINHTQSSEGSCGTRINRTSWAIVFKYDGETVYTNRRQKIIANSENIAILPKESTFKWKCLKTGHYYFIDFDCNLETKDLFCCKIKNQNIVLDIFKDIMNEKISINAFSNLKIYQLLYKLLFILVESEKEELNANPKIKIIMPAITCMNTNIKNDLDNDKLASLCNISTSYFRRLFVEIFQVSPKQYLINLRIKRAKELLQSDFDSVTGIAKEVGYDDVYHFSKLFKQKTGASPLNYLKKT